MVVSGAVRSALARLKGGARLAVAGLGEDGRGMARLKGGDGIGMAMSGKAR